MQYDPRSLNPFRLAPTLLLVLYVFAGSLTAQELPLNPPDGDPQRTERIEPFHMIGNIYYVGPTLHNSSYLFTSDEGHILIDATYSDLVPEIIERIRQLGFDPEDIRYLLSTHAHPDHVDGINAMREHTGAISVAPAEEAEVIESGGRLDVRVRKGDPWPWTPGTIDRIIKDRDIISVGDTELTALVTPGHTRGCTTWTTTVEEDGEEYDVVLICAVRLVGGMQLLDHPRYPSMPQDYAWTYARLKMLPVDVFLGPHGWIYRLQEKLAQRQRNPAVNPFIDPESYQFYIRAREQEYLDLLQQEMGWTRP